MNVPLVAPAAMLNDAGTVAAAVLLEWRVTGYPPVGAALEIVTVPVEAVPPTTDVGFKVKVVIVGAVTVSVAVAVEPLSAAVMTDELFVVIASDVAVNVAVVAPAATVTVAGTVAAAVVAELRLTTVPPVRAALPSVTVPVEVAPPSTDVGLNDRPVTVTGVTVSVAVALAVGKDAAVAVTVAVVDVVTALVVAVNVTLFVPAATVTVAGTVTEGSLELRFTVIGSPAGVLPSRVTVPMDDTPATTVVGLNARVLANGASIKSDAVAVVPLVAEM